MAGRPGGAVLPSLTGLRAVAALGVFASHLRWILPDVTLAESGKHAVTSDNVMSMGAQGVTLFFVLSGFVLAWSSDGSVAFGPFIRRRFARVWPSHATLWVVFIAMATVGLVEATRPLPAAANLALVQTWMPGSGWANSVNPLAWTLSCEAFFYLVFPVAFSRSWHG